MNSRPDGLHGQKRTRFLAIPHSRSMHDLPRQTIPPSRTCVSATYRPAYAYPTRPVSFCPIFTPGEQEAGSSSTTNNRRFSELPVQLDLGLPFGSFFEAENLSMTKAHYSSPDRDSPEVFPNLSRLSQYHGASSSSGLSEGAILSIENSSFTSSAFTAPTSPIDSDGGSSIYECAALDFPEPPPIGSPVIRRMRSSPWFLSADEVDGVLSVPGRGGRVALDRLKRQSRVSSMCLKAESITPSHLKENALGFRDDACDVGAFGLSQRRNSAFLGTSTRSDQYNAKGVPPIESSFGRLPRIIRKVASMRSESQMQGLADAPNANFQRPVPRVRSFRTILWGSGDHNEALRTSSKQDSRRLNKNSLATSTETNAKQRRLSNAVYESNLPGTSSTALGPWFKHNTNWKEDFNKSFIDISPDRDARLKGKQKIRSLLSKANELFSWGRSQRPRGGRLG